METLVRFGRALRAADLPVGPDRVAELCRAAALLPPGGLYWAGRATLVSRPEQIPAYDAVFGRFFGPPETAREAPLRVRVQTELEREVGLASRAELLREKSFARCSREELSQLAELMTRIDLSVPRRRTRRREPARGGLPDLRRTLRRSFRTGGEPLERAWRRRRKRTRRLVLLLDVSGSMDAYSRALLLFLHSVVGSGPGVEAFGFGTRLTRLTPDLAMRDPEAALARASATAVDWGSGTRIGESLAEFNAVYGRRALSRGAVVVIVSDGWERDDPGLLEREMARLARAAYAIVWVNPLKGNPEYQPLAGGMRCALPFVDRFLPGHNLRSLEELAAVLAGIERRHAA